MAGALGLVFGASRVLYSLLGVRFDASPLGHYWQYLDPLWLREDLLRSLLWLHCQPPLFNLFLGVVLKACPEGPERIVRGVYAVVGLTTVLALFWLLVKLRVHAAVAWFVCVFFMLNPATVVFENWLYYSHLEIGLLCLSATFLTWWVESGKWLAVSLFFTSLTLLVLMRSMYQLPWVMVAATLLLYAEPRRWKQVLVALLLPVVLVGGLQMKNLVLFGSASTSSWMGMSLARLTVQRLPRGETERIVVAGEMSPVALIPTFAPVEVYQSALPRRPRVGVPAFDEPRQPSGAVNFNHQVYLQASAQYMDAALVTLRRYPAVYVRSVMQSLVIFFHNPVDIGHHEANRAAIRSFERLWSLMFGGQLENFPDAGVRENPDSLVYVGWLTAVVFCTALASGVILLLPSARRRVDGHLVAVLAFLQLTVLYVALVGNLLEIGENDRFRYVLEPYVLTLVAFGLTHGRRLLMAPRSSESTTGGGTAR